MLCANIEVTKMRSTEKENDEANELLKKISASPSNTDHLAFEKEQRKLRNYISENYHSFVYSR